MWANCRFWVHADTAAGVSEWLGGTKHLWEANPENTFPCLYLGLTLLESMTTQRQPVEGVHPKRLLSPYFQWGCMFSYECLAFLSHCWRMLGNHLRHGASCLESCSREAGVPPRMCLQESLQGHAVLHHSWPNSILTQNTAWTASQPAVPLTLLCPVESGLSDSISAFIQAMVVLLKWLQLLPVTNCFSSTNQKL